MEFSKSFQHNSLLIKKSVRYVKTVQRCINYLQKTNYAHLKHYFRIAFAKFTHKLEIYILPREVENFRNLDTLFIHDTSFI